MAKQDRIDFRGDERIKAQFVETAERSGMNLSTFMITAAQEQVLRVQRRERAVSLSDRDRDRFLAAIERPARPAPEAMKRARERHTAIVVND